jgi:hypothetical protein
MNTTETVTANPVADKQTSTEMYKAGKKALSTFISKVTPMQLIKWHARAALDIWLSSKLDDNQKEDLAFFLEQLGYHFIPEYIKPTIDDRALVHELLDLFRIGRPDEVKNKDIMCIGIAFFGGGYPPDDITAFMSVFTALYGAWDELAGTYNV